MPSVAVRMEVVAYLGPAASYTHQAAKEYLQTDDVQLEPRASIEDVFAAVHAGDVRRGVVPFENSTNGAVTSTLDLLADVAGQYPNIQACGESYIPVHHCLVGRPAAPAAVTLTHITKLYSHPQAWGQCRAFLSTRLKGVDCYDVASTSRAAEIAAEDSSGASAAISSQLAADIYGLQCLARHIEDRPDNSTRFFVICKRVLSPCGDASASTSTSARASTLASPAPGRALLDPRSAKSLLAFTIDHENAGALADALAVFKLHALNLTSINARPSGRRPWHYIFFVESRGCPELESDGAVNNALRDLEGLVEMSRWLGSWESRF